MGMADVDFTLSKGDTAPVLRMQLLAPPDPTDPEFDQYPFGRPLDLTGATVIVTIRVEDQTADAIVKAATVDGDPLEGWIVFEWDGYPGGRYLGRIKATQNNGKQISYPNDRKFVLLVDDDP